MMVIQQDIQPDLLDERNKPVVGRKRECDPADHEFDNEQKELVMPNESKIENAMTKAIRHHLVTLVALLRSSALIFGSP